MPKGDNARVDSALAEVTKLVPGGNGDKIKQVLSDWVDGKGKGKTGKTIKLGGVFHSKDEKESRAQVRAVLLAAQCCANLDPDGQGYKSLAKVLGNENSSALAKRLTDYYAAYRRFEVMLASPHGIEYGKSFQYADPQVVKNCETAYGQVLEIVAKAYQDVGSAIGGIKNSVARYETWFGPMSDGRPEQVKSNLFAIFEALKTQKLVLYYRGPLPTGTQGVRDDYSPFGPMLPAGGENYCGMATRRSKQNLSCPSGMDLHIKLGNAIVLRGCVIPTQGKNTYAGTIVHEISHIVCETRDVKLKQAGTGLLMKSGGLTNFTSKKNVPMLDNDGTFIQTYGPDFCKYMAKSWPDKAVMNADNYCYFTEAFL
jgi:hypothetical protein